MGVKKKWKKKEYSLVPRTFFLLLMGGRADVCVHVHMCVCVYTVLELEFRTSEGNCILHCHEKLDIQFILDNVF